MCLASSPTQGECLVFCKQLLIALDEAERRIRAVHGMPYQTKADEDIPDDKAIAYQIGYEDAVGDARQLLRED